MRVRFFIIILIVLSASSVAMIYLHSIYLWNIKINLIDQQLRDSASALVQSGFADLNQKNIQFADDLISEELGENRIGKFFIVRDGNGEIIFETTASKLLPVENVPQSPQHFTIDRGDIVIRVLNLSLPSIADRTLQVGFVMSRELLDPGYFSRESFSFIAVGVMLGFLVAWFLTSTLLRPIKNLAEFMQKMTESRLGMIELKPIPDHFKVSTSTSDEYNILLSTLDDLVLRVNRGYKLTRLWAYQMSHELKTPLAVINIEVQKQKNQSESNLKIDQMVERLQQTVDSFLNWSELENLNSKQVVFANKMGESLEVVRKEFEIIAPNRLSINCKDEFHIICESEHLLQLLRNLISNALNYSEGVVNLEAIDNSLIIKDHGPGIPESVLERLGDPFNRGESKISPKKGQGLGLAWISSIVRIYSWKLDISSNHTGTEIKVSFNS